MHTLSLASTPPITLALIYTITFFSRLAQVKVTCDLCYLISYSSRDCREKQRGGKLNYIHEVGRGTSPCTLHLSPASTPPVTLSTYTITVSHLHTLTPASNHTLTPLSPSYPHFWLVVDDRMTAAMNAPS